MTFLVKIVTIYVLLVCKIFGPKIQSCNFFDKSQVCTYHVRNFLWGQKFLQIFFVLPQWIIFSGFRNNFSCASSYFHLDNSLWSMRNLYANFWDVNFSTDSFQLSLTSKFEIICESALSKLQNFDRILQFLPGICATMKPGNVSADYIGH